MRDAKGQFKKGEAPGRVKGTPNRLSRTVKETVLAVFNKLQQSKKYNLEQFAKDEPVEFYRIAAKLIPTEISGNLKNKITVEIVRKNSDSPKRASSGSAESTG